MKKKYVCLFQNQLNWFPTKHTLYSPFNEVIMASVLKENNVSLKLVPGNQQYKTALYFILLKVVFERYS